MNLFLGLAFGQVTPKEFVLKQILTARTKSRIFLHQSLNKFSCLLWYIHRIVNSLLIYLSLSYLYINYFLHYLIPLLPLKRHPSRQQFIRQHTYTPNINRSIVIFSLKDLRRCVVESSTVGFSRSLNQSRPPKITQFSHSLRIDNYILRFYVSMGYRFVMHVYQSINHIFQESCCYTCLKIGYLV